MWRNRWFTTTSPPLPSSCTSLPSWGDVVQELEVEGPRGPLAEPPSLIPSLHLFPILRKVGVPYLGEGCPHILFPRTSSLASMHHLTQVSLWNAAQLGIEDLKLLSTLPALASFAVENVQFDKGNEETLREWLAVSAVHRGTKRKAEEVEGAEEEKEPERRENPHGPSLPQRHSPLLLFLHALATKPSFVRLRLEECDVAPFVCDHMSVWPYLLSFSLRDNCELCDYSFARAAELFPALTSFTSPSCSEQAIQHLVAIPKVEELCFGSHSVHSVGTEGVQEMVRGFEALQTAASLRSVQYRHPDLVHDEAFHYTTPRSYVALASIFNLTHLTRLTVPAFWLDEEMAVQLISQHRFPHLRCLELQVLEDGYRFYVCPQTDATLLLFVKPADVVVPGSGKAGSAS